jgi:hypothetical protein
MLLAVTTVDANCVMHCTCNFDCTAVIAAFTELTVAMARAECAQLRCCTAADTTAATAATGTAAAATRGSTDIDDMAKRLKALASKLQAVDVAVVEPALTALAELLLSEEVSTTVLCTTQVLLECAIVCSHVCVRMWRAMLVN